MSSDLIVSINPDSNLNPCIDRIIREWKPFDYMRPCWAFEHSLFVWCDEHRRWNEHGLIAEETREGFITSRVPHHTEDYQPKISVFTGDVCPGEVYYCMGPADGALRKVLGRYPRSAHNAPPVRRVYFRKEDECS